jgi:hypothetical protein
LAFFASSSDNQPFWLDYILKQFIAKTPPSKGENKDNKISYEKDASADGKEKYCIV